MDKKAFTKVEFSAVLLLLVIIAAVAWPFLPWRRQGYPERSSCQSNLKQIALSIKQYVQDYDKKYPLVTSGKEGWMDIIQPYIRSKPLFHCPADRSALLLGTSDYYYNARLSGQEEGKLGFAANTIMNGDGISNSPSNVSLTQIPPIWKAGAESPTKRHLDGANYSFADAHIKWLKPMSLKDDNPSGGVYTFALR